MIEIFTAKTVEEAQEQAVSAFGAPASQIRFEILEQPRRGLYGYVIFYRIAMTIYCIFQKSKIYNRP